MFEQRSCMHHLQCSNLLLPVHDCFFCCVFFFADAAHLLLTHLPQCVGQLFFQQQPRIKSRWVLVFCVDFLQRAWVHVQESEGFTCRTAVSCKMVLNETSRNFSFIVTCADMFTAYLFKKATKNTLDASAEVFLMCCWRRERWVQADHTLGFPLGHFDPQKLRDSSWAVPLFNCWFQTYRKSEPITRLQERENK